MKPDIHPKNYSITVKCVCGAEYPTQSTKPEVSIDVCSNCHPFYTGQSRLMDTEGRVSRFEKKYKHLKEPMSVSKPPVPPVKMASPKAAKKSAPKPKSKTSGPTKPTKKDS